MTIVEAKVAARFNAEIVTRAGIHGYVYSISWVHEKGKEPYFSIGCHDLRANSIFSARAEDLTVEDWKAPGFVIEDAIAREQAKGK